MMARWTPPAAKRYMALMLTRLTLPAPLLAAALLAPALLALAACASPEARLRTGLVNAGLSAPMASCMARPMADRLSVSQLMKLRSLSRVGDLDPSRTSYDQFLRRIRALQDPEIVSVTASAALGCALG
jgi:hypothetical protein